MKVEKVPDNAGCILVIDDKKDVRVEVESLFLNQIKQLLTSYISRK